MIEIRWHGRGGQGAVTSVEMMALAAIEAGKYAQGFPAFGPERRGAPVMAFNRVSDKPIKIRSGIYQPDVVVVLDPSLVSLVPVTDGLKPGRDPHRQHVEDCRRDSQEAELQRKTVHRRCHAHRPGRAGSAHLRTRPCWGPSLKATGVLNLNAMKSPLEHRFGRVAAKNMSAMKRAYSEIKAAKAA